MKLEDFKLISNSIPDSLCLITKEGSIVAANPAAARLLKYDVKDMQGKNIREIAVGQSDKLFSYIGHWASSSTPVPGLLSITTGEGCVVDCQCMGSLMQPARNGSPALILLRSEKKKSSISNFSALNDKIAHLSQEISRRRQTEAALKQSEERFQLAVLGSSDGIWDWNIKTDESYFSPRFLLLLGYSKDDELPKMKKSFISLVHPDDEDMASDNLGKHLKKNLLYNVEQRLRLKSGEYKWFMVRGQAIWDEDNNPVRMAGSITDVSEKKQFLHLLQSQQETLDKAQEIAHVGSWYWNIETNALNWSDEIYRIFGLEPQVFVPTYEKFLETIYEDDKQAVIDEVNDCVQNLDKKYNIEHKIVLPGGKLRTVHEQGVVYRDKDNNPLYMIGTVLDITARVDQEEKVTRMNEELEQRVDDRTKELSYTNTHLLQSLQHLNEAQDQLVQSEKMASLGGLVAGVAHEINTPIGVGVTAASHLDMKMKKYAQLYEKNELSRTDFESMLSLATETSDMILSNLKRAADLIRSFKQVAVDQTSDDQRTFKLKGYIEEVIQSLKPSFKNTRHKIVVDCPEEIELYSYPGAISQIITNIVMNSLIHGFENINEGEIRFDIKRTNDAVLIHYADNGRGVDEVTLNKMFDPFYTTRRGQGGTGLGMHITFNLVTQKLCGTIKCQSIKNKGIDFDIVLPAEKCLLKTVA